MLFLHSIKSTHHTKVLILGLAANKGGISLKQLNLTGEMNNSTILFDSEVNKLKIIVNELDTDNKIVER